MTVGTVEVEKKASPSASSELNQFFSDYWIELQRYDPIVGLLTAWGVFTPPPDFLAKKLYRTLIFMTQAFLAIGLTVQLGCTRDPLPPGPVVIVTLILSTIPVEILNLVWFRVVQTDDELKAKTARSGACGKCLLWSVQYLAKTFGSLMGFLVFGYSTVFFVLTFAGIHPGCSQQRRYAMVYHVVLLQFLLMPVLMSAPYWRDQSSVLSFLGQAGPVIGYIMHLRKYGLHPPPPKPAEKPGPTEVENPVAMQA